MTDWIRKPWATKQQEDGTRAGAGASSGSSAARLAGEPKEKKEKVKELSSKVEPKEVRHQSLGQKPVLGFPPGWWGEPARDLKPPTGWAGASPAEAGRDAGRRGHL